MWEAPLIISGAGVVASWVIIAWLLWDQAKKIGSLRERVAWLEARANGKGDSR
jgi:hypothetical protein